MPKTALIRRPSQLIATPDAEHPAVNPDRAFAEWMALVQILAAEGWQIVVLEPADDVRSGFRVGRLAVTGNKVAVLANTGCSVGEYAGVEVALLTAGYELAVVAEPARHAAADAVRGEGVVYVAAGATNEAGLAELGRLLADDGVAVVGLPVPGPISVLPDGSILGPQDAPAVAVELVGAPERAGQSVLTLGPDSVLVSASAPETAGVLAARGLKVRTVDITELERAGAVLGELVLVAR